MNKLDQERNIQNQAQIIAKQKQQESIFNRFKGTLMKQSLDVITKKVEFNDKFFSGIKGAKQEGVVG